MRFRDLPEDERVALKTRAKRETLIELWDTLPASSSQAWNGRAAFAATMLKDVGSVTDIGCADMSLAKHLPNVSYVPVDCVKRDNRTIVVDLNREAVPQTQTKAAVALGVLEYIHDVAKFLCEMAAAFPVILVSYNTAEDRDPDNETFHTFVNEYSRCEMEALIARADLSIADAQEFGSQRLWLLHRKARAVVLTVATSDYADQWRFCIESQRRYCEREGFEHHVVDPYKMSVHPKWAKLILALKLIERCDILLVDADAEIAADCPRFVGILDEHKGQDILFVKGISGRPNSGVLMLRGGSGGAASAFLNECIARKNVPVPDVDFVTAEGENGHVINVLKIPMFAERAAELPSEWNCSEPLLAEKAYIKHYTNRLRSKLDDRV